MSEVGAAADADSVRELITQLSEPSWTARRTLVGRLAALGDDAVPALIDALRTRRDDESRIAALVDALAASTGGVEQAVVPLVGQLDGQVLADVAQILGRRRRAGSLSTLIALTQHADDNVAIAAIEALGRLGGHGAVEALIACVESGSFFRTFPAIDVLGRSADPRAVGPLAQLLDNPRYALEAGRALGRTADRSAVAPLVTLLGSPSMSAVRIACLALAELCEGHAERYGMATAIESTLRDACTPARVRRIGQSLSGADKSERLAACRLFAALRSSDAIAWLAPLLDAEPEVASAASLALRAIGDDSELAVDGALRAPHSARRGVVLPTIARLVHAPAVELCLDDPEPNVRALAAETLARIGSTSSVPALFRRLEDDSARVVHAASGAIQALGSNETEALARAAAGSPKLETRRAALRILGYLGYPSAFPLFCDGVRDADTRVRDASLHALALLDDPRAETLLLETCDDPEPKLRAASLRALGQRAANAETRARLRAALDDPDPWARYYACQALGRQRDLAVVDAMVQLLRDPAGQVRVAAVEALSHIPSEAALTALRTAAQATDADVQRAALLGIALAGDQASIALLIDAARAPDAATRLVALSALAAFQGSEVTRMLAHAATDADESVRIAALSFLASAPGEEPSFALIALLGGEARDRALLALATPHDARPAALSRALADADEELAPLLGATLVKLRTPAATRALLEALRLPNRAARIAAAGGLSALGTREAYAALTRAAHDDLDPEVRRVCALHLAR